jgi:hypothetical protein
MEEEVIPVLPFLDAACRAIIQNSSVEIQAERVFF